MKSTWKQGGAFKGLTDRLQNINDMWAEVVKMQIEEINKKAEQLHKVAESKKLSDEISEMDRSQLKGRIIE